MKTVNLPEVLGSILLSIVIFLVIFIGGQTLLKDRDVPCLKCGKTVSKVNKHDVRCFLCNHSYWVCQEAHAHCPGCRAVVKLGSEHQITCPLCKLDYFRCKEHTCNTSWTYSRSDPYSQKGTSRPLVEKNITNR